MEKATLYNIIKYLQKGTNIHIGVLFLGNYGNEMCQLPQEKQIHSGAVCEELKNRSEAGYRRCFRCRNLAIKKALKIKKPFGGFCINGIYEYTHPVIINSEVACIIFIGNILNNTEINKKRKNNFGEKSYLLEKNFSYEDCRITGNILESYIRMLLDKHTYKHQGVRSLVENIESYIYSNLEFDISISHIAEFFHYNKLYLGRLFKKETNMSITDYITLRRLEKAAELIENSHESIISISYKVGFNNVTYFNRLFKNKFNMTPTQYRKKGSVIKII